MRSRENPNADFAKIPMLEKGKAMTDATRSDPVPRIAPQGIADQIVQQVAELPDRTSPEDWPEAMLVTADELQAIVLGALTHALAGSPPETPRAGTGETTDEEGGKMERVEIIFNGRKRLCDPRISYVDALAGAGFAPSDVDRAISVTYSRAASPKPDGILMRGQSITAQDGTIINAYDTSNA